MNAYGLSGVGYRELDDRTLVAEARRLEGLVRDLREAQGAIGLHLRLLYTERLDLARAELERRRT